MIIGTITVEAMIYQSNSLKDKRSVIKSISTKIKQRYNVSIVESNHQNVWQRTEWMICSVGTTRAQVEKELQRALAIIDHDVNIEVTAVHWEWL